MSKLDQVINGRPTQRPLNRDEQKQMFETMQKQYGFVRPDEAVKKPSAPQFPIQPIKDIQQPPDQQLEIFRQRLQEYGMPFEQEAKKVETHLEENKTTTTIKQFYCSHIYNPVRVSFMGMPMRYKICSKCGLVK